MNFVPESDRPFSQEIQVRLAEQYIAHANEGRRLTTVTGIWTVCQCSDCEWVERTMTVSRSLIEAHEAVAYMRQEKGKTILPAGLEKLLASMGIDVANANVTVVDATEPEPASMDEEEAKMRAEAEPILERIAKVNPGAATRLREMMEAVIALKPAECTCGQCD